MDADLERGLAPSGPAPSRATSLRPSAIAREFYMTAGSPLRGRAVKDASAQQIRARLRLKRSPRRKRGTGAMSDFHRMRRLPPYVFEQVNPLKAKARAAGADIIDLGMGNPDLPAPKHVIDKLVETVGKPRTDRYSASKGIPGPAPRPGELLRPPLRREAQSRDAGRRDPRLQGRLRQHGAGDHRAGRRRAGAQPVLPHPRLRLPDGGRRRSARCRPSRTRLISWLSSGRSGTRSPSPSRWSSAIPPTRPRWWRRSRFLQRPRRLRQEARDLRPVRSRL